MTVAVSMIRKNDRIDYSKSGGKKSSMGSFETRGTNS